MFQWIYGLFLELITYCAHALLGVMSTDLTFWENSVPVAGSLYRIMAAVGWGLLIGNCVFQSLKAMLAGLGFETESPVILLLRTALFGTLLMFSKDICDIGLSIGKNVMNLIGIPSSITITMPTESMFGSMGAGWLLVILIGFILGFQLIKLFFEIAERYVVVAVLTLLCPVGLAMGGSRSTKDICTGFMRTYASMIVMMVMNVLFLKLILSALATMPDDILVLPWCLLVVGIAKTARKADNLISKIGLNPAFTGDPLGHGRGAMAAVMAAKTIVNSVSKAGKAKSGGKTGSGVSRAYSHNRNMSGGTNVKNAGASLSSAEQQSSSAAMNSNSNIQNVQGVQNSQSSRFGAPNSTTNTRAASSNRFGAVTRNNVNGGGTITGGNGRFGGGKTQINTNRFGVSSGSTPSLKAGAARVPAANGGKSKMQSGAVSGKTTAKSSAQSIGKKTGKLDMKAAPLSQKTVRFGTNVGNGKTASPGGLRQNANPFKTADRPVSEPAEPAKTTKEDDHPVNEVSEDGDRHG